MSLIKVNEIQVFNGTTVTITATTAIASADLTVTDDLDVGGALTLGTALAIAEGGTGATTASAARTALGLEIGTDVQAYDADTAKYDDTTANFTGTLQNGGSNVVVDSDIGSTVQAYDAGLTSIAGLTTAANKIIYTTASDTYAVTDLTAAGRAILDDADAAAQRTTLGLGTAATTASTDYATAAQGSLADSAVQPGDDANTLGSGAATDGYVLTADGSGGAAWEAASGGGSYGDSDVLDLFNSTGSAPVYACRAWVNFRGTTQSGTLNTSGPVTGLYTATVTGATTFTIEYSGTTYTVTTSGDHEVGDGEGVDLTISSTSVTIDTQIRASGNVSSITDFGPGKYGVNFTTAMPDENYCWSGSTGRNATPMVAGDSAIQTTSNFRISVGSFTTTYVAADADTIYVAAFR